MAGKKAELGDRSNRFRFVMLEADLSDTNVNALAQAIVSALRSEAPTGPRRLSPVPTNPVRLPVPPARSNGDLEPEAAEVDATDEPGSTEDELGTPSSSTPPRPRKPSRPTQPKYANELFPSTTEADDFKAFVAQYPTDKDSERYLIAALYLRDHGHPIVNMHKVYTCYRTASWPMAGLNDWDVNLRNQIRNDRFRRVDGGYSLTTNGESVVQALRTP